MTDAHSPTTDIVPAPRIIIKPAESPPEPRPDLELVRKIAWLTRMLWRTRKDDVEHWPRRKRRKKIGGNSMNTSAKTVGARVLGGTHRRVGIDIRRDHGLGAGTGRRQRDHARPGSDVDHDLATQVDAVEERDEASAGKKEARMEHGRAHVQLEPADPRHLGAPAVQDEMIGEEVNKSP